MKKTNEDKTPDQEIEIEQPVPRDIKTLGAIKYSRGMIINITDNKSEINGPLSPSTGFPHVSSPLSPLEKCETALEIREDGDPVVGEIKISNQTYLIVIATNMAAALINSTAAGLGIYSVLTASTDSSGFGIAFNPLTGGILAFAATGVLLVGFSYNSSLTQIKTIKNLMQDIQLSSIQKANGEKRLHHQETRFLKNILITHQEISASERKLDQNIMNKQIQHYFSNSMTNLKLDKFSLDIEDLYNEIIKLNLTESKQLTPKHIQEFLSENPTIVSNFFTEQKATSTPEKLSKRRSICLKFSYCLLAPISSVINFLGTTSLINSQAVQMTGSTLPVSAVVTTGLISFLGGLFTQMGLNSTTNQINSLERQKETNQQAINDTEEKISSFASLANYSRICSSELNQDNLVKNSQEDKEEIDTLRIQLKKEREKNSLREKQIAQLRGRVRELEKDSKQADKDDTVIKTRTPLPRKYAQGSSALLVNCTTRSPTKIIKEPEEQSCIIC